MNKYYCRICGNSSQNRIFIATEKKYGSNRKFEYLQCSECGSLQRVDLSIDVSEFYPPTYYSLNSFVLKILKAKGRCFACLRALLKKFILYPSFYRTKLYKLLNRIELVDLGTDSIGRLALDRESKVLDVGSGSGTLLFKLKLLGFGHLTGIDPYIPFDSNTSDVKLIKSDLLIFNTQEKYNCIIFYHSLEHVNNPFEILKKAKELLYEDGIIVIAIPIINFAFEIYGTNWVGLDVPVHNHLFTREGFDQFLKSCGLKLRFSYFNSQASQFFVSEKYQRNVSYSLVDIFSVFQYILLKLLTPKGKKFRSLASNLNVKNRGDQAVFYVSK